MVEPESAIDSVKLARAFDVNVARSGMYPAKRARQNTNMTMQVSPIAIRFRGDRKFIVILGAGWEFLFCSWF